MPTLKCRPGRATSLRGMVASVMLAVAALTPGFAHPAAADYPARPIRMIVPFVPGGASDFVARILQPKLSEDLGQPVVIDNRAGAAGNIGVELTARAAPDGYTILLGNVGTMAINPAIFTKFPIRPVRDLTCVSITGDIPGAMAVNSSLPVKSVKEFIEYARARPGKLNYGSSGVGAQRLMMDYLILKSGISMVHIPYKGGGGAATTALLSGELDATILALASFTPHVKGGRIRVIAVIAPKRVPVLPEVPTMVELGYPELTNGSWQAIYLPARTPQPIVRRLHGAVVKAMTDNWVEERLQTAGTQVIYSKSLEACTAFMTQQTDFWSKLVKQVGVVAE